MRHRKHKYRLGRSSSHRKALISNLAMQLILNRKIETTVTKAKATRPFIEKLITKAIYLNSTSDPNEKVNLTRFLLSKLKNKEATWMLIHEVAPKYVHRMGGYVRIRKTRIRLGDAAEMALLELIDDQI